MINALNTISLLQKNGKQIRDLILNQAIDFAYQFYKFLSPLEGGRITVSNLGKKGMPREGGPIARMLYEHEITKALANSIVNSAKIYIASGKYSELIKNIDDYVNMIPFIYQRKTKGFLLWMICYLMNKKKVLNDNLTRLQKEKLDKIGNFREYYEKLIDNINLN